MKQKHQILTGVLIVIAAAAGLELIPIGGLLWMVVTALLGLAVIVAGREVPLTLRVVATGFTAYLGFLMCLAGRTTEPYLTAETLGAALGYFALIAALPTLAMLRCWDGRARVLVVSLIPAVSLLLACSVAAVEESRFIARHENGVGPTARWTVSDHWLAYDAATRSLTGGD